MNEHPGSLGWNGSPQERMPALSPDGRRDMAAWQQPAAGYPAMDVDIGQPEGGNVVHDLLRSFWILVRHRWLVGGVAVAFVSVGLLATFLSTPIYRASTTMQIDREAAKVVNTSELETDLGSDAAFYATQYEVLKSRSLAEQVASGFSVEELQQFTNTSAPSLWSKLRGLITGRGRARTVSAAADVDVAGLQKGAAYRVMGGLSVQPVGSSRLVRLNFEHPDPVWAQRIVNAVAKTFVSLTLNRRFESSSYARTFLQEQLQDAKVKLEDAEKALVGYAQAQGIVNVDERKSLVSANLEKLNSDLAETGRQRVKAEQLIEQAQATGGLALPQIMNDESVRKMREKRAELAAQYQDKLGLFKPAYPEMQMLKSQINEIDSQINASVNLVKESLRAESESAKAQQTVMLRQLETLKGETLDLESRGIQYRILQREVDTNRQLYDGLLQRFKEVGVAGAVGTNNVTIVDAAERPGAPFKPILSKNLMLALALGLFVGSAAAIGLEILDDTFKVPEEVESGLGLPVLGIVPVLSSAEAHSEALNDSRSALSEAYRSLRTALQFSTAEGAPRTLLVTSSRPNEGKSTTALSLAKNFGQLGSRVLLIDADLRSPSLHRYLNVSNAVGLSNYLAGDALPLGSFQQTQFPGLTFMASGPLPPNPAELLAGPKMASLLTVAASKFDTVIIDGPPVMGIADAPLLGSVAEGTLLIVEAGQTRRGVTKAALKRLHFARSRLVGTLLNKFDAKKVGHTYGYGYGHGYGYGYGDHDYYGYGTEKPKLTDETAA